MSLASTGNGGGLSQLSLDSTGKLVTGLRVAQESCDGTDLSTDWLPIIDDRCIDSSLTELGGSPAMPHWVVADEQGPIDRQESLHPRFLAKTVMLGRIDGGLGDAIGGGRIDQLPPPKCSENVGHVLASDNDSVRILDGHSSTCSIGRGDWQPERSFCHRDVRSRDPGPTLRKAHRSGRREVPVAG